MPVWRKVYLLHGNDVFSELSAEAHITDINRLLEAGEFFLLIFTVTVTVFFWFFFVIITVTGFFCYFVIITVTVTIFG
jgi:hypothetical protein